VHLFCINQGDAFLKKWEKMVSALFSISALPLLFSAAISFVFPARFIPLTDALTITDALTGFQILFYCISCIIKNNSNINNNVLLDQITCLGLQNNAKQNDPIGRRSFFLFSVLLVFKSFYSFPTCVFSTEAVCRSHIGLTSIPSLRSKSPC